MSRQLIAIAALVAALLTTSSAFTQEKKAQNGEAEASPNVDSIVNRVMGFDKNKDGKLSKDELPERLGSLLTRADTNKDGAVTKDELTDLYKKEGFGGRSASGRTGGGRGRQPGGFGGRPGGFGGPGGRGGGFNSFLQMFPVMAALDADKDGTISEKEMANATAALKKLDKNQDGKLTAEEMRPNFGRGFGGFGGGRGGIGGRKARPGGFGGGAKKRPEGARRKRPEGAPDPKSD